MNGFQSNIKRGFGGIFELVFPMAVVALIISGAMLYFSNATREETLKSASIMARTLPLGTVLHVEGLKIEDCQELRKRQPGFVTQASNCTVGRLEWANQVESKIMAISD